MRKPLLLLLFALLVSVGMAQPVLDQSGVGAVGSVYYIGIQDSIQPGVVLGPAGANQSWSLHFLVATSLDTITYVTPASTGYAADFPTANLGIQQASLNNGVGFMESSSTDLQLLGFVADILGTGTPIVAYQQPPLLVSQFPFTYLDTFSNTSTIDVTIDASSFGIPFVDSARYKNIQVRDVLADGYGTLELPTSMYSNVLRIKEINTQTDSTWIHVSFTGWQLYGDSVYTDSTFTWSDNTSGYLLAQADYVGGVLDNIRSQDFVLVGRAEPTADRFQVYPNPASERIVVKGNGEVSQMRIVDLQGRLVAVQTIAGAQSEFSVASLPMGCYLYTLMDAEGMALQSGKLLLTR
jgi:hypothetical protein